MLSCQAPGETNPKSEARKRPRGSKQTGAKINSKPGKSKTRNPNRVCLEHCICFWSFEFVSDFGPRGFFRASNFKSLWLEFSFAHLSDTTAREKLSTAFC
jgi:hypothetical protein